jgi:hypothetical protein
LDFQFLLFGKLHSKEDKCYAESYVAGKKRQLHSHETHIIGFFSTTCTHTIVELSFLRFRSKRLSNAMDNTSQINPFMNIIILANGDIFHLYSNKQLHNILVCWHPALVCHGCFVLVGHGGLALVCHGCLALVGGLKRSP